MDTIKTFYKTEFSTKNLVSRTKDINSSVLSDINLSLSMNNLDREPLINFNQLISKLNFLLPHSQNALFKPIAVNHSISSSELKKSKIMEEYKKASETRSHSFPNVSIKSHYKNEDFIVKEQVKFFCNVPECDNQNKNDDSCSDSEIWDEWDDDDDDGYIGISDTLKFPSCAVLQMTTNEILSPTPKNTLSDVLNQCSPHTTCDLNWNSGIKEEIEKLPKGSPTDTDDILICMQFNDEENELKQRITDANCNWGEHYSSPLPIQSKPCKVNQSIFVNAEILYIWFIT